MAKDSSETKQSPTASEDQVVEQHRRIKEVLNRIGGAGDLQVMVPLLQELRILLEEHFEDEEAPGAFPTMIAESAPHHARSLDRLFAEHGTILSNLDAAIAKALLCLKGPVAEVRTSVADVCEQLRVHEATETELLTDTVYTDLGTGD